MKSVNDINLIEFNLKNINKEIQFEENNIAFFTPPWISWAIHHSILGQYEILFV